MLAVIGKGLERLAIMIMIVMGVGSKSEIRTRQGVSEWVESERGCPWVFGRCCRVSLALSL